MQKRILVPLDGSPLADRILTQLERLLTTRDHEVVLLTVVPDDDDAAAVERQRQDARDRLAGLRDALVEKGALASVEVLVGDPAETIVEHARRIDAELVVMATHGRTGLSRFVRGSVAESVIRACSIPVLVANPRAVDTRGHDGRLRIERVLVPLDGSETAAEILPVVESIARPCEAEVLLLRVQRTTLPTDERLAGRMPPKPEQVTAALEPVRRELEQKGLRARALAAYGPEALAILDAADREGVDLVAMSTHGRRGPSRWLFGSVAEQVLRHCTRPLLVRRAQSVDAPPAEQGGALSERELIGAKVQDLTHTDLGTVDDLLIDPATGQVTYALLSFGGLLGVGDKLFPVPWARLRRRADGVFVLQHQGKRREELKDAPHVTYRYERIRPEQIAKLAPAVHSFYPSIRL